MKLLTANDEAYFKVRKRIAQLTAQRLRLSNIAAEYKKKSELAEAASQSLWYEESELYKLVEAYERGQDIVLLKLSGGGVA